MERWRDGEMERWRDGEMERWRDGEMERWRDGEMERTGGGWGGGGVTCPTNQKRCRLCTRHDTRAGRQRETAAPAAMAASRSACSWAEEVVAGSC